MACDTNPGGGWVSGAGAQEENLCRRSSLSFCLADPFAWLSPNRKAEFYPLPELGVLHSKNVCFFRGAEHDGYPFLAQPQCAQPVALRQLTRPHCRFERADRSYVSAAAHGGARRRRSRARQVGRAHTRQMSRRAARRRRQRRAGAGAERVGRRCLCATRAHYAVLASDVPTQGCPPRDIAEAFREVLGEDEFRDAFVAVAFGIFNGSSVAAPYASSSHAYRS